MRAPSSTQAGAIGDYRCLLSSDCTAEPLGSGLSPTNHEAALLVVETLFGWVADSGSSLRAVTEERAAAAVR